MPASTSLAMLRMPKPEPKGACCSAVMAAFPDVSVCSHLRLRGVIVQTFRKGASRHIHLDTGMSHEHGHWHDDAHTDSPRLRPALRSCEHATRFPARPPRTQGDWPYATLGHQKPIIIGHRGASGALPEHTLEAYQRALNDGADCIEPDLVFTKDGVLVSRHDTWLSTTTNVASKPEFADRKRKSTDPEASDREDWWVADFTLAEIKTLRAIQPFKGRSKAFDNLYTIPTFDEVLDLAKSRPRPSRTSRCASIRKRSRPPTTPRSAMRDMAEKILAAPGKHGHARPRASPVFIQSFEPDFVKKIDAMTDLPVVDAGGRQGGAGCGDGQARRAVLAGAGRQSRHAARRRTASRRGVVEASHARGHSGSSVDVPR